MSDDNQHMDGASAGIFKEMTRQTIIRKIERLSTGELIDLLGHLIIRERQGPHF